MRRASLLVAAMLITACQSRTEDEAGPAPETDRDDPVTHAIDTTRTGPPGVGGRPPDATVTMDSVVSDTTGVVTDTTGDQEGPSPISTPQDTLGPGTPESWDEGADTTGDTSATGWTGAGEMDTMPADTADNYR